MTRPALLTARAAAEPDRTRARVDGFASLTFGTWHAVPPRQRSVLRRGGSPPGGVDLLFRRPGWVDRRGSSSPPVHRPAAVAVPRRARARANAARLARRMWRERANLRLTGRLRRHHSGPSPAARRPRVDSRPRPRSPRGSRPVRSSPPDSIGRDPLHRRHTGAPQGRRPTHANLTYGCRAGARRPFRALAPTSCTPSRSDQRRPVMLLNALDAHRRCPSPARFHPGALRRLDRAVRGMHPSSLVPAMAVELLTPCGQGHT